MADTYQWTALPRGVDPATGRLQLSVLVSPTVDSGKIEDHPFFRDWPTIAKNLKFDVWMNGKAYASGVAPRQDLPDSAVWGQLFGVTPIQRPSPKPPGFLMDYSVTQLRDQILAQANFAAWKTAGRGRIQPAGPILLPQSALANDIAGSAARRDNLVAKYRHYPQQLALLRSLISEYSNSDGSDLAHATWDLIDRSLADSPLVEDVSLRLPSDAPPTDILASVTRRDALRAAYAGNPGKIGLLESLIGRFSASDGSDLNAEAWHLIATDIHNRFPGDQTTISGEPPTKGQVLAYAFHRFHRVDQKSKSHSDSRNPAKPANYDFHQRITLLLGYPYLLRLTALVVELEIGSVNDFGVGKQPLAGTVGVLVKTGNAQIDAALNNPPPTAPRPTGVPTSTLTYYEIFEHQSQTFFLAGDPKGGVVKGVLDLRKMDSGGEATSGRAAPYFMETLDTDGAGWKAISLTYPTNAGSDAAPAPRTAGILFGRVARAAKLNDRLQQPSLPGVLGATDVMRAIRLDVWTDRDREGRWRSLHEREVAYHFFDRPSLETGKVYRPQDKRGCSSLAEGMVSFATSTTTQMMPDPTTAERKAHETLARWDNWGLSTDFPVEPLSHQDSSTPTPPDPRQTLLDSPFPMCATSVPLRHKLPALRIGGGYKLRCRAVDLAGNGLGADDWRDEDGSPYWIGDPDATDFEALTYRRWEPVAAPQVLLESQLDLKARPGDSLETIVMRGGSDNPTLERYVAPPRILRWMAEIHGCFDGGIIPGAGAFANIVLESDGSFPMIRPVEHGSPASAPPAVPKTVKSPTVKPQTDPILIYRYHSAGDRKPYYPDPYAPECTVRLMTNDPVPVELDRVVASFYPFREWPYAMPFRLVLQSLASDRTATISYNSASTAESQNPRLVMDTVTVSVRPGATVQLYIQSNFGTKDGDRRRERMALWNYLSRQPAWSKSKRDQIGLESLTPVRILKLVHAVKLPVDLIKTSACVIQRDPGSTNAGVTLPLRFDAASTDPRFEIATSWVDIDDKSAARPIATPVRGVVTDFAVATLFPNNSGLRGQSVNVTIKTTSDLMIKGKTSMSFGPSVTVGGAAKPGDAGPVVVADPRTAVASIVISKTAAAGPQTPIVMTPGQPVALPNFTILGDNCGPTYDGLAIGFNHSLASTKFRRITYEVTGHSKYRDQYPPGDANQQADFKRTTKYDEVCALSTARPPSPGIVYTVPSFEWERERTHRRIISRRRGGCVRIYLERPWFESGEGELVGILFIPQVDASLTDTQIGLSSVWGSNPIWRSGPLLDPIGRSHFRGVSLFGKDLSLDESGEIKVSVAGYEPYFDVERGLWYCDVKLDPGAAYFPYVRMAVARYQPNSLSGVELSRVVLAPFAQLAPHREVQLEYAESDHQLELVVRGVSYLRNSGVPGPSRIVATVEERCSDVATTLGWVPTGKPIEVPQDAVIGVESVWRSVIDLPGSRKKQHYRIAICEEETLPSDDRSSPEAWKERPPLTTTRTIFADAIEI